MSRHYPALIPLALAIGIIAAGCGSDSSGETTTHSVSIPVVTAPGPASTTAPATSTSPGKTATQGGKTFNPQEPDSETNDVPPKKGSPQAAFEQQCKQQGTCD